MIPNLNRPEIEKSYGYKVYTKIGAIPKQQCLNLIEYGENQNRIKFNNHKFSNRFETCLLPLNHEIHNILQPYWKEIIEFYDYDLTFIEPYELKKYVHNDFFGSHIDCYFNHDSSVDRKITLIIQLSEETDYKGGNLCILNKIAEKEGGTIKAFPSYYPHEVTKNIGTRWSLIGWAWGPYWK